ncbi:aspartyl-tRNA synthetase [Lysinibacillus xylanilyticus]|uniref:aspartyl-tRNA synthetase n=1 Tax=Lysinibacillus xylanilyticus TaxID=582475 RepID=UPI0037FD250E
MKKRLIISVSLITLLIAFIWLMSGKSTSHSEPQEALFSIDYDLSLIPSYKINDKALFFFIKNTNNLGAVYVQKGIFGWKAGMLTWSPMDVERAYEKLNGYQIHGDNLIYGLIKQGNDRIVEMDGDRASMLNLAMLPPSEVEKLRLEGLYIWYFESDKPLKGEEIKLFNKDTGEELDRLEL